MNNMSAPSAKMLILTGKEFACIRIIGRATFTTSIDLRTVVEELRRRGYSWFVLELSDCALMDSTFLGVLAGYGLKMSGPHPSPDAPFIELLNSNPRVTELLESLGVLHLFKLAQGPLNVPADAQARTHVPTASTREEITRASLEAHQCLMEINPSNVAKFKDVAQFLAEDLKRIKGQ